ncbi:hypothetical protein PO181_00330 [Leuconostoc suionicum]|uniref:hypothetical protein n=1 Tax=Leuconostoc suionicum TaxID=1511761 RepID=UPI00233F1982|nr:hypothetical protein [Leuconostoc suionicum]MDC2815450.1 hypothetical protein [Leuconostoc suionicum]
MRKKDFVTMLIGTISGFFFAIGMCMALLPEWHARTPGIVFGVMGMVGSLVAFLIRRKMEGKPLWTWNTRIVLISLFGLLGATIFGIGMVMSMVWNMMIFGIIIGFVGIVMLVTLFPMIKGFEE